jgi:hypothetical protein
MGFTVSSLTNYVNQESTTLLTALQFEGETAALANIVPGVKSSQALQILTNSPFPQDGTSCGFNASGDSAFTQATITTLPVKYQDSYCPRALEAKWTQNLLKKGQTYTESDLAKDIIDDVIAQIKRRNETLDWQGDTTAGDGYLNKYNGIRKAVVAASGVQTATASTYNASNCRAIVKSIILKIPAAQKGDPKTKIYMGYDAAEIYRQALMDANLFHVAAGTGTQKGMVAEGSVHEIVPVHGLDEQYLVTGNANMPCIFAMDFDRNVYLGCDAHGEEDKASIWLDGSDNETIKYSFRFRRGWQVAFGAEIVKYANS